MAWYSVTTSTLVAAESEKEAAEVIKDALWEICDPDEIDILNISEMRIFVGD